MTNEEINVQPTIRNGGARVTWKTSNRVTAEFSQENGSGPFLRNSPTFSSFPVLPNHPTMPTVPEAVFFSSAKAYNRHFIEGNIPEQLEMPHITFHTDAKSTFCPADGFDEISTTDLENLLRQSRASTASLEGELMKRQPKRKSDQSGELGRFCERLHSTARELIVRERLDRTAANNVDDAIEVLIASESDPRSQIYQAFLYDVLHHCNTGLTLLCAASLGRKKILHLGTHDRVSLLAYVRDAKRSLDSPILTALANEYNVPSSDST